MGSCLTIAKGVFVKKLLLIGTILIAAGCAPRRDEVCCNSHTLSTCEPAIYFEYDSAKICFEKAAFYGNVDALYELGNIFYRGLGVKKDSKSKRMV